MDIEIRPLAAADVGEADRIFRLAFGTFLGLPDPLAFMGDADMVGTRWRAAPGAALGAYADGVLVGSNFAANWGSFGFFGPLTIRPDLWDQGIARRLLTETMLLFETWGTSQIGLFTFPDSAKHLGFYGKLGFAKQMLTPVMAKPVSSTTDAVAWSAFSDRPASDRPAALAACSALTDAIFAGLDLSGEILAIAEHGLGDTVLVEEDGRLAGFATCHVGGGSEAGSGATYVKFGAVRPGTGAAKRFADLLTGCEALAAARGAQQIIAGVNAARSDALGLMRERGFATIIEGVAMQRPDSPGFNRADCFVIDDWR